MEIRERNPSSYNPPPPLPSHLHNQQSSPTSYSDPGGTIDHHHLHNIRQETAVLPPQPRDTNHPDPDPGHPVVDVQYRECLKNHTASMGVHVLDGCGEFMPGGGGGDALKCAACDCHRSFHRREEAGGGGSRNCLYYQHCRNSSINMPFHHRTPAAAATTQPLTVPPPPAQGISKCRTQPAMMMIGFGGGGGARAAESSSEDLNNNNDDDRHQHGDGDGVRGRHMNCSGVQPSSSRRKRFRTRFSQEQKERMQQLAERLGWRIQKQDEHLVMQFCEEVGVKRQVLKVWMHNNKQPIKKN